MSDYQMQQSLAGTAMRLTGADVLFERMLDGMLAQVRRALGAPMVAPGSADVDPVVEAEFHGLRQRLTAFFPEYEQIYERLLEKYVGAEQLPHVVATLMSEPMRRYFHAMREMESELLREVQTLAERMGQTTLHGSGR